VEGTAGQISSVTDEVLWERRLLARSIAYSSALQRKSNSPELEETQSSLAAIVNTRRLGRGIFTGVPAGVHYVAGPTVDRGQHLV
jgi:hypothetical protein